MIWSFYFRYFWLDFLGIEGISALTKGNFPFNASCICQAFFQIQTNSHLTLNWISTPFGDQKFSLPRHFPRWSLGFPDSFFMNKLNMRSKNKILLFLWRIKLKKNGRKKLMQLSVKFRWPTLECILIQSYTFGILITIVTIRYYPRSGYYWSNKIAPLLLS